MDKKEMGEYKLEAEMKTWRHIFKLDPAKDLSDEQLKQVCLSGTDAIIIGGTDNVTYEDVQSLLDKVADYDLPCILEVSTIDAVMLGFDAYFIPMVMNSHDKKWMMDIQHEAIKKYKAFLDFSGPMFMEGYCILNPDCKAYRKANCKLAGVNDVLAYAYMAENFFNLPIFYLEYSGTYGNPELVAAVKEELTDTLLFYGGGIVDASSAREMKRFADVIIVGNVLYTDFKQALATVSAIKMLEN